MTRRRWGMRRTRWERFRRVWAITGTTVGVIFIGWSVLAYRASGGAYAALETTETVTVSSRDGYWRFEPRVSADVGLLFFPGALVDPVAYAPLVKAVAERGYTVVLIQVPRRGAMGGAESAELAARYMRAMRETDTSGEPRRWIVAGHSRGGVISSNVVRSLREGVAGLVLVGTSHPRDFSLAHLPIPVTQVFGTRDTVADLHKVEAARRNLPPSLHTVRIDGGNHSQFGSYGFQPGDWPATITREEQQRLTVEAIVAALARASALR